MDRRALIAAVATVVLGASVGVVASADAPGPLVGATEPVAGRSYTDWEVDWYRWSASLPVVSTDYERCADAGQREPVWFLGGQANIGDKHVLTRNCSIPAGRYLMLGLPALSCSDIYPDRHFPSTARGLQRCARTLWHEFGAAHPQLILDGVPLKPASVRVSTPAFDIRMPATHNIFDAPGRTHGRLAVVGNVALLRPLSPGIHKLVQAIHYPWSFNRVVIYRLTVG
jgi:hypothetical protein